MEIWLGKFDFGYSWFWLVKVLEVEGSVTVAKRGDRIWFLNWDRYGAHQQEMPATGCMEILQIKSGEIGGKLRKGFIKEGCFITRS